jgi:hypothetical protein
LRCVQPRSLPPFDVELRMHAGAAEASDRNSLSLAKTPDVDGDEERADERLDVVAAKLRQWTR